MLAALAQPIHIINKKEVEIKEAFSKNQTQIKLNEEKEKKLFIINYDPILTEGTLNIRLDEMTSYFSQYGEIEEIKFKQGGNPNSVTKKFGFVVFEHEKGLENALKSGEFHDINGKQIVCKRSLLKDELNDLKLQRKYGEASFERKSSMENKQIIANEEKTIIITENHLVNDKKKCSKPNTLK